MKPKSKVNGILLKRQTFGEYNEKLTFFTDILGKTVFYSYGSKSPRSSRRALLAYPALLQIIFEKKGNLIKLLELERIVSLWNDSLENRQNSFVKLWPHIDKHIPLNSVDGELFTLLRHFFQPKIIAMASEFLDLILLTNLLRHLGLIGLDFSCEKCKKLCHQNLIVADDNSLWGKECYQKFYKQPNQMTLSKNSFPSKNFSTSKTPLILSIRSIALIKTLVKHPIEKGSLPTQKGNISTQKDNLSTFYEMYQKNFTEKEDKKDWENAYQYLERISKSN